MSNNILGNSFMLDFHDRVKEASIRNFQLIKGGVFSGSIYSINWIVAHKERVLLQFGKVKKHEYIMDVQYPLSLLQAFGICLSVLDKKYASYWRQDNLNLPVNFVVDIGLNVYKIII